jgi:hypothetical protein
MTSYTEATVAKMKEIGTFNYDSAKAFAEANSLPVRSVIAKIRVLDLAYQAKGVTKVSKKDPNARSKADIVTAVNDLLDTNLTSLTKLTVKDLEAVEAVLMDRFNVNAA